jgi:hypothetical protein
MDLQDLILRIKGDSSGAESALGKVGESANKFGGIVKTIVAGAAVAASARQRPAAQVGPAAAAPPGVQGVRPAQERRRRRAAAQAVLASPRLAYVLFPAASGAVYNYEKHRPPGEET